MFTADQLNRFNAAQELFANADAEAVEGLMDQIEAVEALVYGPGFTYTDTTFTAPSVALQDFATSLSGFLKGNKGLVKGLKMIKAMNVKTVSAQQDNEYCKYCGILLIILYT